MKILLLGANGQLGTDLAIVLRAHDDEVIAATHAELDVCDGRAVEDLISRTQPDAVINTAAFHKVEACEQDPQRSFAVNATAVMGLARSCAAHNSVLVHFSTDYVFGRNEGTDAYVETDLPGPLNVYGASKLAGELLVPVALRRFFIIRTCGLYGVAGSSGKGGNFVENMLRKAEAAGPIRVVDDQVLTPTSTHSVAEGVAKLIRTPEHGLYHMTCEGACSWYEFTKEIFKEAGVAADLLPVKSSDFPSPVQRPSYSVLSKQKLRHIGVEMPDWRLALRRYLGARQPARAVTV